MRARQLAVLSLFVLLCAAVLAVPALGSPTDIVQQSASENETDGDEGLGLQVSSFAQSSAADARNSAESGMWNVSVGDSTDPGMNIEERTTHLETRLAALENETSTLGDAPDNLSAGEYNARASRIRAELENVRTAIDDTNRTAHRYGVNATQLEQLRTNAANMSGPEVATVARNITDAPRGPPAHAGPPGDVGHGDGNETGPSGDVGPNDGNETGPPGDVGPGERNETGEPGDVGPSDRNETDDLD